MNNNYLEKECVRYENEIKSASSSFLTIYHALFHLQNLAQSNPEMIGSTTISTIQTLLKSSRFPRQRQRLFLFRQAANTLRKLIESSNGNGMTEQALAAMKHLLNSTSGHAHRAVAESLGDLPFSICGPPINDGAVKSYPLVCFQDLLKQEGIKLNGNFSFKGRSLVIELNQKDKLLAFKFARENDTPDMLLKETTWLNHFHNGNYQFPLRFNIPQILSIDNRPVFRLKNIPTPFKKEETLHSKRYAIGIFTHKDYFSYPNDSEPELRIQADRFKEVILRNAWLLGELASLGIIHSAPIPLFHNRVQRQRRRDHGLYEWYRGGRLDRWLDSCTYPNIGITGIRDFEHFLSFNESNRSLFHHIGNHLLSLFLITGSYFRYEDKNRMGFDDQGKPVDARDLFDKVILRTIVQDIFLNYYQGFVGLDYKGELPFNLDLLVTRMIEEMGTDRHMEEVLRVVDQNEMSDDEFTVFLQKRGYSDTDIRAHQKGANDIVIHSGPHLGGFNNRISIPELIESIRAMSALCMAGRYGKKTEYRANKPGQNFVQMASFNMLTQ